ncbi:hypothetical protein [Eubacterium sp.]
MKIFLILAVIIFIVLVLFFLNPFGDSKEQGAPGHSNEYMGYYNSVNQMSIKQLHKIHDDLLPLVMKTLIGGIVYYDDEIPDEKKEEERRQIESNYVVIPEKDRIYGCVTYDEADKLNRKVLDRLRFIEGD